MISSKLRSMFGMAMRFRVCYKALRLLRQRAAFRMRMRCHGRSTENRMEVEAKIKHRPSPISTSTFSTTSEVSFLCSDLYEDTTVSIVSG